MATTILRLTILSSIVIASFALAAAADPPTQATPGLTLTVSTEAETYQVGDLIVLVFTFENKLDHDVALYDGTDLFQSWFHELEFADESGKPISYTGPMESFEDASLVVRRLRPGGTVRHKLLLNGWKLAGLEHPYTAIGKEPRKFVVTGTYRTPAGLDVKQSETWIGRVSAQPIIVSIERAVDRGESIAAELRQHLKSLAIYMTYVPKQREDRPNIELYAPVIGIRGEKDQFHITDEQCQKIFDLLVEDGFFKRAEPVLEEKKRGLPVGRFYDLTVSVGSPWPMYHASIGWDKNTIATLKAIETRLDGPAATVLKQMRKAVKSDLASTEVGK